jgi:hypothetical protein|tara:strand:- start:173 stop:406 length:234 start_codon:yes stop_codon:yes gene_type:complete
MKWEKIRTKTINGNGRLGFLLPLTLFIFLFFEFKELGKDGVLELVSDPIFYIILVGVVLFTLIIMFILNKIFPTPKS